MSLYELAGVRRLKIGAYWAALLYLRLVLILRSCLRDLLLRAGSRDRHSSGGDDYRERSARDAMRRDVFYERSLLLLIIGFLSK